MQSRPVSKKTTREGQSGLEFQPNPVHQTIAIGATSFSIASLIFCTVSSILYAKKIYHNITFPLMVIFAILFFTCVIIDLSLRESIMKEIFNFFKNKKLNFYTEINPLDTELNKLSLFEQMNLDPNSNKSLYDYLQQKQTSSQTMFNEIIPGLFLGNRQAGYRTFEKILGKKSSVKFNSVVTVFKENTINEYHTRKDDLNAHHDSTLPKPLYSALKKKTDHFYHFPLDDVSVDNNMNNIYELLNKLDEAVQFITNRLASDENVLVHCNQGASRSATIVVAYLIKEHHLSLKGAINHVKHCRPCVDVSNFQVLLEAYEKNSQAEEKLQEEDTAVVNAH